MQLLTFTPATNDLAHLADLHNDTLSTIIICNSVSPLLLTWRQVFRFNYKVLYQYQCFGFSDSPSLRHVHATDRLFQPLYLIKRLSLMTIWQSGKTDENLYKHWTLPSEKTPPQSRWGDNSHSWVAFSHERKLQRESVFDAIFCDKSTWWGQYWKWLLQLHMSTAWCAVNVKCIRPFLMKEQPIWSIWRPFPYKGSDHFIKSRGSIHFISILRWGWRGAIGFHTAALMDCWRSMNGQPNYSLGQEEIKDETERWCSFNMSSTPTD